MWITTGDYMFDADQWVCKALEYISSLNTNELLFLYKDKWGFRISIVSCVVSIVGRRIVETTFWQEGTSREGVVFDERWFSKSQHFQNSFPPN